MLRYFLVAMFVVSQVQSQGVVILEDNKTRMPPIQDITVKDLVYTMKKVMSIMRYLNDVMEEKDLELVKKAQKQFIDSEFQRLVEENRPRRSIKDF